MGVLGPAPGLPKRGSQYNYWQMRRQMRKEYPMMGNWKVLVIILKDESG